jgi:hypothetical protein
MSVLTLPDALPEVLPDAPPETEPLEFTFVSVLPEVDVEPPVSSPLEICAAAGPTPTMSAARRDKSRRKTDHAGVPA